MRTTLETLWQDLRYCWRTLWKSPGFTLVALLTLALGIGANSAIFSVINAALLQPLPYPHPDQLVLLYERNVSVEGSRNPVALANFLDWQAQNRSFAAMAAVRHNDFNLGVDGGEGGRGASQPERITGAICSWSLFPTLGVRPVLGRTFSAEEDKFGARPVVVISYGMWQRRFGGAPDVLQRKIRLDSKEYDIIGVMPQSFAYPDRPVQVWAPVQQILPAEFLTIRGAHQFYVIARVRDGVSKEQAFAELDSIERRVYDTHPGELVGRGAMLSPLSEEGTRHSRTALLVLFSAVGCLLLIACVNIANLLLARGSGRRREMAIRAAMGAGRSRLQRQLLTESILLSALGAGFGVLLAYGLTSVLATKAAAFLSQGDFSTSGELRLDGWVFLFTAAVALVTGVAIGLVPAWQTARADLTNGLKESSRSASANRGQRRFRSALVTAEVALSMMLLVATVLLLRSFAQLQHVPSGVRVDHVLTAGVSLPDIGFEKREQVFQFARQLRDRLQALPGARSADLVTCLPVGGYCGDRAFFIDGRPLPPGQFTFALYRAVTPGYFETTGIPVLQGRAISAQDGIGFDEKNLRDGAVVISQSMARKFWPQGDALGQRIRFGRESKQGYRVIGIVGDVLIGLDRKPQPTMYLPLYDGDWSNFFAVVHTAADPLSLASAVRHEISSMNPDLPAFEIRTLAEVVDDSTSQRSFTTFLLGLFASLALALTAVGLYGVLSYSVAQRTMEIGIRLALGAERSEVRRLVLFEGMRPALLGVILGLIGASWATQFVKTLLFEISSSDRVTLVSAPALLLAIALASCVIPAWRATRVDPATALRSE